GVTEYSNGEDADSRLNRADMLLYDAKGNGRNRIVAGLAPVQLTLDEPSEREGMACRAEAAGAAGQSSRQSRNSSRAFWACSRFSASSQAMQRGSSSRSWLTSSPRWAGRQCINTTS